MNEQTNSFYGNFLIIFLFFLILLAITHTLTLAFWGFVILLIVIWGLKLIHFILSLTGFIFTEQYDPLAGVLIVAVFSIIYFVFK